MDPKATIRRFHGRTVREEQSWLACGSSKQSGLGAAALRAISSECTAKAAQHGHIATLSRRGETLTWRKDA